MNHWILAGLLLSGPNVEPKTEGHRFEQIDPAGLTAAEVAKRALVDAPELQRKDAEIASVEAQVRQNRRRYVPSIELYAKYTRLSRLSTEVGDGYLVGTANPGTLALGDCGGVQCVVDAQNVPAIAQSIAFESLLNNYAFGVEVGIPLSDWIFAVPPSIKGAKAQVEATKAQQQAQQLVVQSNAQLAYYGWLRALAGVDVAQQSVRRIEERQREIQIRYDAGQGRRDDVLRLTSNLASARAQLEQAEATVLTARQRLASLIDTEGVVFTPGESMTDELPPVAADARPYIETARANRPEILALRKTVSAQSYVARATRVDYAPKLTAFGDAQISSPNPRAFPPTQEFRPSWAMGVSLTYNIAQAAQTKPRLDAISAQTDAVEADLRLLERELSVQVTDAHSQRRALDTIVAHTREQEEASIAAYELMAARVRHGSATVTDLLDAETQRNEAQLQRIDAELRRREATVRLRFAMGLAPDESAP